MKRGGIEMKIIRFFLVLIFAILILDLAVGQEIGEQLEEETKDNKEEVNY